jgi:hypothetical protein
MLQGPQAGGKRDGLSLGGQQPFTARDGPLKGPASLYTLPLVTKCPTSRGNHW